MKKVMAAWILIVMAVMACGFEFSDQQTPTASQSPLPSETMRVGIMTLTPTQSAFITAPEGVRLRDRPDAAGPGDSVQLDVLHPGDQFSVESCLQVNGHWWAHGRHNDIQGWVISDYLSPNPCKGAN